MDFTARQPPASLVQPSKAALALTMGHCFLQAVERGEFSAFAALAQRLRTSRAWVSMRVELTFLAPRIQHAVLLGSRHGPPIQELVRIARLNAWRHQLDRWNRVESAIDPTIP